MPHLQPLFEQIDFTRLQPLITHLQPLITHTQEALVTTNDFLIQHQVQTRITSASLNACTIVGGLSLLTYAIPSIYQKMFHSVQNLRLKYPGSKWALVTGGSSGIGLAIVERLASQGLNVVVVAFPDTTFDKTMQNLAAKYPHLEFRKVGVNLGLPGFLPALDQATKDIDINIIFNNAGYIKTGFFCDVSLEDQLANHNCNATAAVIITHHFGTQMLNKKLKGCICFTSSPAGFTPCPFSAMYGATKAYLTEFAMSIAPELYPDGIDVCVVHPSPTASRFYDGAHSIGVLLFFKGTAIGPARISDALFSTVGRSVVRDQGYYPPVARLIGKMLDINLFADIIAGLAGYMPEFKTLKKKR